jgi:C-terminal processing protease CtpA/Prc
MLRQEHEEAMLKQREEHAAELERMLGEQREMYESRVNELQKEREELRALGDYSPEAPRLFGVGMRLEVRDDGGYYIKKLVEGGGAYKSGLVMEGDKVGSRADFRGFVSSRFGL